MDRVINLFVIVAVGVILADLVVPSHVQGTNALISGVSSMWSSSVNGMLGNTSGGTPAG